jgi:hypothetical protein
MSGKKKREDVDVLAAVDEQALADAADEIEAMSKEELAAAIRADGGDPDAIAARGKAHAEKLMERRTRLAWQAAAQSRLDRAHAVDGSIAAPKGLSRSDMLARIAEARRDPRADERVAIAFRKRSAEHSTDEELAELLREIEVARKLKGDE